MSSPRKKSSKKTLIDRPLQSPRIIVCEGADEYDILSLLQTEKELTETDVEILDAKGRDELLHRVDDAFFAAGGSDIRLIGLVLDTEDDLSACQTLICSLKEKIGDRARVLVYQLPDEKTLGAIETMIRQQIAPDSVGAVCASNWEQCMASTYATSTQAQRDKAWLQVWLTSRIQSTAYSRIGYAIKSNPVIRQELDSAIAPLKHILEAILSEPLE